VTHKKPFTLRLDDDLRERAERVARSQERTLTSLMTYALAREVAEIEAMTQRKPRESVTSARPRRAA